MKVKCQRSKKLDIEEALAKSAGPCLAGPRCRAVLVLLCGLSVLLHLRPDVRAVYEHRWFRNLDLRGPHARPRAKLMVVSIRPHARARAHAGKARMTEG